MTVVELLDWLDREVQDAAEELEREVVVARDVLHAEDSHPWKEEPHDRSQDRNT